MKLSHVKKIAHSLYKIYSVTEMPSGMFFGISVSNHPPHKESVCYSVNGFMWHQVTYSYINGKNENRYIVFRLGNIWYKASLGRADDGCWVISQIGVGVCTVHGDDEFFQWTFPDHSDYEFWIDGATNSLAVIGSPQKGLVEISDEVRLDEDDGVDTLLNILKQKAKDSETTGQTDSSSAPKQEDKENENGKAI